MKMAKALKWMRLFGHVPVTTHLQQLSLWDTTCPMLNTTLEYTSGELFLMRWLYRSVSFWPYRFSFFRASNARSMSSVVFSVLFEGLCELWMSRKQKEIAPWTPSLLRIVWILGGRREAIPKLLQNYGNSFRSKKTKLWICFKKKNREMSKLKVGIRRESSSAMAGMYAKLYQ